MEHAVSSKAISSSTHSGIVVLMPTKLAASLQSVRHYHSGRVLHLHLRDALQRDLHVIAVYGVSSPMQNAAKQRLNADVHQVVATLLARYAGSAILVAGDINTAWRAQDRQSGQLERYDTNPHALWKLFSQHGLSECHTVAWSERTDMTFKPTGRGCRASTGYGRTHS
jgi:exonuclease III